MESLAADEESILLKSPIKKNEIEHDESHGMKVFKFLSLIAVVATASVVAFSSISSTTNTISDLSTVEEYKVFEILAVEKKAYQFECTGHEYAYCGTATCNRVDRNTSACGCLEKSDSDYGTINVARASLFLIQSSTYRKTALLAYGGHVGPAKELICDAIIDGTLWKEAGFDTSIGSFYYTDDDDDDDSSTTSSSIESSTESTKYFGSCMGAPCTDSLTWNSNDDECALVCLCPWYSVTSDDDDDEYDSTCFDNVKTSDDDVLPWTETLDALKEYIDDLQTQFKSLDSSDLSSDCDSCTVS
jgi:hypothetical protein